MIRPVPRAGKMNQILRCEWLTERTRWSYLARSGLSAASRKKKYLRKPYINSLLTRLVRSRWLDIGLGLFSVLTTMQKKNEMGQYLVVLTSHLINSLYSCFQKGCLTKPYATMPRGIMGNRGSRSLIEDLGVSVT